MTTQPRGMESLLDLRNVLLCSSHIRLDWRNQNGIGDLKTASIGYMTHSLETIGEIVKRIEDKIDSMNGKISESQNRINGLEIREASHQSEVRIIKFICTVLGVPLLLLIGEKFMDFYAGRASGLFYQLFSY